MKKGEAESYVMGVLKRSTIGMTVKEIVEASKLKQSTVYAVIRRKPPWLKSIDRRFYYVEFIEPSKKIGEILASLGDENDPQIIKRMVKDCLNIFEYENKSMNTDFVDFLVQKINDAIYKEARGDMLRVLLVSIYKDYSFTYDKIRSSRVALVKVFKDKKESPTVRALVLELFSRMPELFGDGEKDGVDLMIEFVKNEPDKSYNEMHAETITIFKKMAAVFGFNIRKRIYESLKSMDKNQKDRMILILESTPI